MKKLTFAFMGILVLFSAVLFHPRFSNGTLAPFNYETDLRFKRLEAIGSVASSYYYKVLNIGLPIDSVFIGSTHNLAGEMAPGDNGTNLLRVAKAAFVVNGSTGNGATSTTGVDLGVHLPAKSSIIRSWIYTDVTPTYVTNAALAFSVLTANNIKTSTAVSTYSVAGTYTEGQATGAASAFAVPFSTQADIYAVVATQAISTGTFDVYVEYVNFD